MSRSIFGPSVGGAPLLLWRQESSLAPRIGSGALVRASTIGPTGVSQSVVSSTGNVLRITQTGASGNCQNLVRTPTLSATDYAVSAWIRPASTAVRVNFVIGARTSDYAGGHLNGYVLGITNDTFNYYVFVGRYQNGTLTGDTRTGLANALTPFNPLTDRICLRLEVRGTSILGYLNGKLVAGIADSLYTGAGYATVGTNLQPSTSGTLATVADIDEFRVDPL